MCRVPDASAPRAPPVQRTVELDPEIDPIDDDDDDDETPAPSTNWWQKYAGASK